MTNKQQRAAQKHFPATRRNEHLFSTSDIDVMPNTGIVVPPPVLSFESKGKTYVIRTEGKANSFGIGKVISPGVASFASGQYGMTKEMLALNIAGLR